MCPTARGHVLDWPSENLKTGEESNVTLRSCFKILQGCLIGMGSGVQGITRLPLQLSQGDAVVTIARIYAVLTVKIAAMTQAKISCILLKRLDQYF